MNHKEQKNMLYSLLRIIIGLSVGLLYLYYNGVLKKYLQEASSYVIATGLIAGVVGVSIAVCVIYFVRRQLNSKGLCPIEIGDERVQLIQYKAAFKTLQYLSAFVCVVPIFLFIDYKLSLGWLLLIIFLIINLLYVCFNYYFSKRYV